MIHWDLPMLMGIVVLVLSMWLLLRYFLINESIYINRPKHNWKSIKLLNRACFCSNCEILLSSTGKFCDHCGVASHPNCIEQNERNLKCKEKYNKDNKSPGEQKHKWIQGNLPLNCICYICNHDIDAEHSPGLYGFRCCWCHRSVHTQCFTYNVCLDTENCDFGEFAHMIIPPSCITAIRRRGTSRLLLKSIKPPPNYKSINWKPLILIANMKSGSSLAEDILTYFRAILNPLQLIELNSMSKGPENAIKWLERLSPIQCRILIAGGDGTVGWIMNTIFERKIKPFPEIAVLPLGTGNDLSRVLNWGSEIDEFHPEMATELLRKITRSRSMKLDRWLLELTGVFTRIPIPQKHCVYLYNYFSIGVDAQVTLNFHKARESAFYLLSNRIINKLIYLCYGTHQVLQPDCVGLEKSIELYLDDVKIDLPVLQSVVCLNIDSWGAGVKLWELSEEENESEIQSPSDGIMEVFGIVSSFHIAQLQVGLSKPIRLGRAKKVRIKLHESCPVQADGEPWIQLPCEIKLHRVEQANVLTNTE